VVHVPCVAHTLNLVEKDVDAAVPQLAAVRERVSAIVTFFRQSHLAAAQLEAEVAVLTDEVIKALKLVESERTNFDVARLPRRLKKDMPTRWNSVRAMLARYYALHVPVALVQTKHQHNFVPLNQQELEFVLVVCNRMRFVEATSLLVQESVTPQIGMALMQLMNLFYGMSRQKANTATMSAAAKDFDVTLRKTIADRVMNRFFSSSAPLRAPQLWNGRSLAHMSAAESSELPYVRSTGFKGVPQSAFDVFFAAMLLDPRTHGEVDCFKLFEMEPWRAMLPPSSNISVPPVNEFAYRLLHSLAMWHVLQLPEDKRREVLPANLLDNPLAEDDAAEPEVKDSGAAAASSAPGKRRLDVLQEMLSGDSRKRRSNVTTEIIRAKAGNDARAFIALDWRTQPSHLTDSSANPLLWWKEVGERTFPCLAVTAKRLFAVLPSSAEAERFASTAGDTTNSDRCALNPAKAAKLVFLAHVEKFA